MATIHVREKFHYTDKDGKATPYAAGTHTNVPDEVAAHPFVKAHCDATAMEASGAEAAAALGMMTAERDTARDEVARLTSLLDLAGGEYTGLKKQFDELTAERDTLANQVAELQAGGDAPAAASKKK